MEKYIIILIIIIIFYYLHKRCIQSECDNILNTKNNIDEFTNVDETQAQQEQEEALAQQEQTLLEIQSKIKENMKAFYALVTQGKDNPEVEKNLITKNSTENFSDMVGRVKVSSLELEPEELSSQQKYTNNILYSPEIEEIIHKFRVLVYTVSKLPQTNQTMNAFLKLGKEVITLSETQVLVNDLRALVSKLKIHLPKSLNSVSQGLTQPVIYILDRLLTYINELLLIYSNTSKNLVTTYGRSGKTDGRSGKTDVRVEKTDIRVEKTDVRVENIDVTVIEQIFLLINKVTQGLGLSNDIIESIKNEVLTLQESITGSQISVSDALKTRLETIVSRAAIQYTLLKSKHIKEIGFLVASYVVAYVRSSQIESLEQSLVVATTAQSIIIQAHKYMQDSLEIATNMVLKKVKSGQLSTWAQLYVAAAMEGTNDLQEFIKVPEDEARVKAQEEAQKELYYLTLTLLTSVEPNLRFIETNMHRNRFAGKQDEVDKIINVFKQTKKNYTDQGYPELGLIIGQALAQRELATIVRQTKEMTDIKNSIFWKKQVLDVIEKSSNESYNQIQKDIINKRLVQLRAKLETEVQKVETKAPEQMAIAQTKALQQNQMAVGQTKAPEQMATTQIKASQQNQMAVGQTKATPGKIEIKSINVGNGSLNLKWMPPNDGINVQKYIVVISQDELNWNSTEVYENRPGLIEFNIPKGLSNGTRYYIRIAGVNNYGYGQITSLNFVPQAQQNQMAVTQVDTRAQTSQQNQMAVTQVDTQVNARVKAAQEAKAAQEEKAAEEAQTDKGDYDESERKRYEYFTNIQKKDYFLKDKQTELSICGVGISKNNNMPICMCNTLI